VTDFKPRIHVFQTTRLDKLMRGSSFAFIDLVDNLGIAHQYIFEERGVKIKLGAILTSKDFSASGSKVAIVFARTRSDLNDVRKAVGFIASEIYQSDGNLFELYVRAHSEGFFPELSGAPSL